MTPAVLNRQKPAHTEDTLGSPPGCEFPGAWQDQRDRWSILYTADIYVQSCLHSGSLWKVCLGRCQERAVGEAQLSEKLNHLEENMRRLTLKILKRYENLDRHSERLYLYEHHLWMTVHLALLSYSYKKNKQDHLPQNYLYFNLWTLQNKFCRDVLIVLTKKRLLDYKQTNYGYQSLTFWRQ